MLIQIGARNQKGSVFNINPLLQSEQEKVKRLEYKPKKIRYLLLGKSMPASGFFFYFENSDLYRYTKEIFLNNFSWEKEKFLNYFMKNGFYLDDLCQEPIDDIDEAKKRKARKAYEQNLSIRIKEYKPLIVVSLIKSIERNVDNAILKSGLNIPHIAITSPFRGRYLIYMDELDQVIKKYIKPLFTKPNKEKNR